MTKSSSDKLLARKEHFAPTLAKLPTTPGVYLYRDSAEKLLYVGKAINLKSRVSSYFSDSHEDRPQIPLMLKKLVSIDWLNCENETEALVLEANLVRQHQPPYNIQLRDDKHYPYIKITWQEPFPRLLVVRKVLKDGARYFGPFTDASQIRRATTTLRKLLKIRSCNLKLSPEKIIRPCIDYAMGLCSAPCAQHRTVKEYSDDVTIAQSFFMGKRSEIIALLKEHMLTASNELKFEQAGLHRDRLADLKKLFFRQGVDLRRPGFEADVFAVYEGARYLCFTVMMVRDGVIINQNNRAIKKEGWDIDAKGMLIIDYYTQSANDLPAEVILDSSFDEDAPLIEQWLYKGSKPIVVTQPKRGDKSKLIERAARSGRTFLSQHYIVDGPQLLEELAKATNLPRVPRTIEAFDISNLGPTFTVAGMVHFADGKPDKSNYRRFKIKGVEGQNDFAMMIEAVSRRLSRLEKENKPFPDLLLIDGGKGQLSSAAKAISHFKNPPMLMSLAKKEELLISPYTEEPVQLGEGHPVRRLMERIRNEVHRFAITYHRKLRGRQFQKSLVEEVRGIGPKKCEALLKTFGSAQKILEANDTQLLAVEKVSPANVAALREELGELLR